MLLAIVGITTLSTIGVLCRQRRWRGGNDSPRKSIGTARCIRLAAMGFLLAFAVLRSTPAEPVATSRIALTRHEGSQAHTDIPLTPVPTARRQELAAAYGKLPLTFEANQGQTDRAVRFFARGNGYSVFLTPTQSVLALRAPADPDNARLRPRSAAQAPRPSQGVVLRMTLLGSSPGSTATGLDEMSGTSNYFVGNDPTQWRTNVPSYGKVRFERVYPGVDLEYYGNQRQLEYDFIVAPGADPSDITLGFSGAERLEIDAQGELALQTHAGEVRWHKPTVYQEIGGARHVVDGRYVRKGANAVAFDVGSFDRRLPLVIDPVLVYSTYVGGTGSDVSNGIAVDAFGSAYIVGYTSSTDFPLSNAVQPTYGGGSRTVFVTKLNPAGTAFIYSTYLGGNCADDGNAIAVLGIHAFITGDTCSTNFPTTPSAFRTAADGSFQVFVTRLSASGGLDYSTFLGRGAGLGLAVDGSGDAYVTGNTSSTTFPTTPTAFQLGLANSGDAFVTKLSADASALLYSSFLGGNGSDTGYGIAVDSSGYAYVTGMAEGPSGTAFPTVNGFQSTMVGSTSAAFVAKFDTNGAGPASLLYSTLLGVSVVSSNGNGNSIAVDGLGNAYVAGTTGSPNFPTTAGAFQRTFGSCTGCWDAFIAKIDTNASGPASLVYSTYLGGSSDTVAHGIAVDASLNAYVTGYTLSANFPTVNAIQPALSGPPFGDAFVTKLDATGGALVYSTFLGGSPTSDDGRGIALDVLDNAYVTGITNSTNFPVVTPVQGARGNGDAFVSKIGAPGLPPPPNILLTLSASPLSLALIASSTKTSQITLESLNGISDNVQLAASAPPTGVTVTFSPNRVTVPSSGTVSTTLSVATNASPSPAPFTLTITATSASGVKSTMDLSIVIAPSLAMPTCGCTTTGPFRDPRVKGLVPPTQSGDGPGGLATVTANAGLLTLTRHPDNKKIFDSIGNVSAFGFSPNGKFFVLITYQSGASGPVFSLTLYSVPGGGVVGTSSPLVMNPTSWGFSPDADNNFFVVTTSTALNGHVDVTIYSTQSGKVVMAEPVDFSSFGPPPWNVETDVDANDSDDDSVNANNQVGGWGFSPDGNTFVLSYKIAADTYDLGLWNLTRGANAPLFDGPRKDVAAFWQFSPCGDLFMLVTQAGANPAPTDPVYFYLTSNGRPYNKANQIDLAPPASPAATVVTNPDGSEQVQTTGMSVAGFASPQCTISGTMHSPANILLTAPTGGQTGFDANAGSVVNSIPGGTYTGIGTEPQTVTIPFAAGTYLIDAFGLDSLISPAPYRLTIAAADGSGEVFAQVEVSAMASPGSDDRYPFTVGTNGVELSDTTPPAIQCAAPDGQWHPSDVILGCTASDSQSGLANPADASFSLVTHVPAGTETGNASTDSRQVCDKAGNCATAGPIAGNQVDRKPPTITVTAPAGTYLLGQAVTASYSCTDGGSGVAICSGTVPSGVSVNTAAVGVNSFTVNAVDRVGNSNSSVANYAVVYNICPLYDASFAKKSGSAYPIKLQLCDAAGNNVSSSSVVVHAVSVTQVSTNTPATLADTGSANPDFDFRYDVTLAGYIFNLSTGGYATGTYRLNFTAGSDQAVHSVLFAVK